MKTNRRFLFTAGLILAMALTSSCTTAEDPSSSGKKESAYYGWYGNGSATNYTISTAAQLRGLADIVRGERADSIPPQDDFRGKTITLEADIATSGEWVSIGYSYIPLYPFNGTFDGNNKTISGINVNNQGVFGFIGEYGTVKNIIFTDISFGGSDGSGGLARRNNGTIQNVGINGNSTNADGGLVFNNTGTIENSYFSGSINGYGGIAGYNSGTIRNSYSTGSINGCFYDSCGGVVGYNSGTVQNCYSTSVISGYEGTEYGTVGGIAGSNDGTIQNCYATGSVSGSAAGGIAGDNRKGTIQNCYATGSVSGRSAGGIAVRNIDGTIQNSVALNQALSQSSLDYPGLIKSTGRINGGYDSDYDGSKTKNYGSKEMVMRSEYTIVSDVNGKDGADITSAEWGDANWWQNTVQFSSNVWEFGTGLPILKNMPTGTQNPEVAR